MAEWFETFFEGLYARVLPHQFSEAASREQARTVRRLLGVRRGQRVLDVPCGQGRLTLPLAAMGLEMTGADLTAAFLRRARRKARQAGLPVRFVQADMRELAFDAEFDAAFNWFSSFGYFADDGNLEFLRRAFRALRPGGRFLLEGMNQSWLVPHLRPRTEETLGGVRVAHANRWDAATSRVRSTGTMTRGRTTERHTLRLRVYSGPELRTLLREAGFRDIRLFGHPPVGRLTRHSRRLLAVGTRPR